MSNHPKKIDFIVAGVHKGGTTWLYRRLSELSQFELPPKKELHYFDRDPSYPSPSFLSESSLIKRMANKKWLDRSVRDLARTLIKNGNIAAFLWKLKFYTAHYNDDWYTRLFADKTKITGEITPDYSMLNEKDIEKMHNLFPNLKLIFILRNPLERAWSHYEYSASHLKRTEDIMAFINSKSQELRSDYMSMLDNYQRFFPGSQILICFFEAIREQPIKLLQDIVSFLDGNVSEIDYNPSFKKRINTSEKLEMPEEVKNLLREKYSQPITQLTEKLGGYCNTWLQNSTDDSPKSHFPASIVLSQK